MGVAIYARYSSENQSEKSIDDQVRVCKNYVHDHELTVEDRYIFVDEAISGSIINRPGLQALEKSIENKEVDTVIVDDLSRLSRSNHQMLTMVLNFNYHQVKIISVSEGISTDDENSKLGIHIRGFINELYLDDLKKKTMRGLEGQKIRGFSAGESVYGYSTHPYGELISNRKGEPKYAGMVHKIHPEEAEVVRRIFEEFIYGKSLAKIAKTLNNENISTKKGRLGGWNTSTLSRILKNEKYIGEWIWRKYKNVRDPLSGKIRKIPRPQKEQIESFHEDLVIIDKETWQHAQGRWKQIDRAWPMKKNHSEHVRQRSYVHASPTHLLSGLLRCHLCHGPIVLLSGKGSGYYGCYNTKRKSCTNRLLVPRKRLEERIISELQENMLTEENMAYIYAKVENLVRKELKDVPRLMMKKKRQYDHLASEIQNYVNYIKKGHFSNAVSEALKLAETNAAKLKEEMTSMEYQRANAFVAPPRKWISDKLSHLRDLLNQDTPLSAEALRTLLGPIDLEPVFGRINDGCRAINGGNFKPYYVAHTRIQTLALLDDEHRGSNWLHWRRE